MVLKFSIFQGLYADEAAAIAVQLPLANQPDSEKVYFSKIICN